MVNLVVKHLMAQQSSAGLQINTRQPAICGLKLILPGINKNLADSLAVKNEVSFSLQFCSWSIVVKAHAQP